jgi:pimeloyl-ACP methyl ester carboxylesterase
LPGIGKILGVQINLPFWMIVTGLFAGHSAWAQRIAGDWQGMLGGSGKFRVVLRVQNPTEGTLRADLYSIDQSSAAIAVQALTMIGSAISFEAPIIHGSYKGTLSADGTAITGTWTQRSGDYPLNFVRAGKETAWALDQAAHAVSFVQVEPGVKLEVLDFGGAGKALVLLAGLGNNAHGFDLFASKLKTTYHVYAITRRGYGTSDTPPPTDANYSANRLGDDVIAVLDALHLAHPVLVGHSIAGEELSSIGSRHPERVAGLVYLDAGYRYAAYDKTPPDFGMDRLALMRNLAGIREAVSPQEERRLLTEIAAALPTFENDVKTRLKELASAPDMTNAAITEARNLCQSRLGTSGRAIREGMQAFQGVRCPALAIFAVPHQRADKQDADADAKDVARVEPLIQAFERGVPQAKIVRMPHANHSVFTSNQAAVIREIDEFVASLRE